MNTKFYDLSIETLDDGTIRLEQRDYCGEPVILDLHPAQAAYIADYITSRTHQNAVADTLQQPVNTNIPNNTGHSNEPSIRLNAELF